MLHCVKAEARGSRSEGDHVPPPARDEKPPRPCPMCLTVKQYGEPWPKDVSAHDGKFFERLCSRQCTPKSPSAAASALRNTSDSVTPSRTARAVNAVRTARRSTVSSSRRELGVALRSSQACNTSVPAELSCPLSFPIIFILERFQERVARGGGRTARPPPASEIGKAPTHGGNVGSGCAARTHLSVQRFALRAESVGLIDEGPAHPRASRPASRGLGRNASRLQCDGIAQKAVIGKSWP
jgi:hypothetical protein